MMSLSGSIRILLIVATLASAITSAFAAEAVVKAKGANLRAGPSVYAEILGHVKNAGTVTVLGQVTDPDAAGNEPKRWTRVGLPAGTPVFVGAGLLDSNGKVTGNRLTLRAGPGTNYTAVGSVPKGTALKKLRQEGGWTSVAAPAGSYGFIASDLLDLNAKPKIPKATNSPMAKASPGKLGPGRFGAPPPLPVTGIATAPRSPGSRLGQGNTLGTSQTVKTIDLNQQVPPPPQVPTPVDTQSSSRQTISATTIQPAAATETFTESSQLESETTESSYVPSPPVIANVTTELHLGRRLVTREGVLGSTWLPNTPAYLELRSFRRGEGLMNFVFTEEAAIELKRFRNKHVLVTGEEWVDDRWPRTPLLRVQAIESIEY